MKEKDSHENHNCKSLLCLFRGSFHGPKNNSKANKRLFNRLNTRSKHSVEIEHDKFKVHSLTGRITSELMLKAFKAVKRNRGSAGIDKISIQEFEEDLFSNLESLMHELKTGKYQPSPLRRVHIPKGNGKTRPLGIPTVRCRVAQEVVRRLIDPTFEKVFHDNSFGFRQHRNCHKAVERTLKYAQQGYKYVVDADIKGFFDNIPLKLIMESVAAKISDGNILDLIEKFLTSGVIEGNRLQPTIRGTPQGGVISPLLANIVLNHLDWYMEKKGYKFVRYADDFIILCKTKALAKEALNSVKSLLEEMGLEISQEKTRVCRFSEGFDFLGFHISSRGITIREKSVEKFKETIRKNTIRSRNLDQEVIEKLNHIIRGTVNFFATKFSTVKRQLAVFDAWIRSRIRSMKFKRKWKTDNYRFSNKRIDRLGLLSCVRLGRARMAC
jgi:RNA-directed DNA polymerase